jgi:hypothetical protein
MTVAFVVLAHRNPEQLALLLSVLRHPQVRLYLHIDRRARLSLFRDALSGVDTTSVTFLPRRRTRWGGSEVIDAALDGIARGLSDGCGYFVLISGQDFPLRPAGELVAFAEEAGSRSYLEHWPIPTPRWRFGGRDRTDFYTYNFLGRRETCIPRGEDISFLNRKGRAVNELLRLRTAFKPARHFPTYLEPFGGWLWWNLSRAATTHVLRFTREHPDYRQYHAHTLSADEVFFPSILLGTGFAERHEIVNDSLRFTDWSEGISHPRTLTEHDLPAMLRTADLFARKFDVSIDSAVLQRLSERLAS